MRHKLPKRVKIVGDGARDVRSQWLEVNVTDSQRAYARELAIERRRR